MGTVEFTARGRLATYQGVFQGPRNLIWADVDPMTIPKKSDSLANAALTDELS